MGFFYPNNFEILSSNKRLLLYLEFFRILGFFLKFFKYLCSYRVYLSIEQPWIFYNWASFIPKALKCHHPIRSFCCTYLEFFRILDFFFKVLHIVIESISQLNLNWLVDKSCRTILETKYYFRLFCQFPFCSVGLCQGKNVLESIQERQKMGSFFVQLTFFIPQQPRNIFIGVLYHPRRGFCRFKSSSESSTF